MSVIVKLFVNGKSQAVRIPKALEFAGVDEVVVQKQGDALVIRPVRKNRTSLIDMPKIDEDFMGERPPIFNQGRVDL